MFKLLKTEGAARRGEFTCAHGTVQTPVFMNVGTQAAIKGALSAEDLMNIGCQVELSNTYHLHLRPGDEVVKKCGGLHKFMTWDKPTEEKCPKCGKSLFKGKGGMLSCLNDGCGYQAKATRKSKKDEK